MTYKQEPSPNFKRGRRGSLDLVVVGVTDAHADDRIKFLCSRKSTLACHYVISNRGDVTQLVDEANVPWFARANNDRGICIELEDVARFTPSQIQALETLCREILGRHGLHPQCMVLRSHEMFKQVPPERISLDVVRLRKSVACPRPQEKVPEPVTGIVYSNA